MGLITGNMNIIIELSNLEVNSTIIKRKGTLFTLTYNQHAKYVSLIWKVSYHSRNIDNSYGDVINNHGISDYYREVIADNTTMVNATTGEILIPDQNGEYPQDINYMGQYDWFNTIAESGPLHVHNMIRAYGSSMNWGL